MVPGPPTPSQLDAPNTLISHPLQKSSKQTVVCFWWEGSVAYKGTLVRDDRVLFMWVCPLVEATIKIIE